jgi:hypothetical protein
MFRFNLVRRSVTVLLLAGAGLLLNGGSPADAIPDPTPTGIAGMATWPDPSPGGYWLALNSGAVLPFGGAPDFGDVSDTPNPSPDGIVAMVGSPNPTPDGYWLLTAAGKVYTFGAAQHFGDVTDHPGAAVMGYSGTAMAATPEGDGYWIAARCGRVYAFGGAVFYGDTSDHPQPSPGGWPDPTPCGTVAIAATPTGDGYWLAKASGWVLAFGDADHFGDLGDHPCPTPTGTPDPTPGGIVGFAATPTGGGYWLVTAGGRVCAFGDAPHLGDLADHPAPNPGGIAGIVAWPNPTPGGYWLVGGSGKVYAFGAAKNLGDAFKGPDVIVTCPGGPKVCP